MKIDWKKKLTSRKLWVSVAGFVAGLIVALGGGEDVASTVSGCIMSGASVIGYLLAEGLIDSASVSSSTTSTNVTASTTAKDVVQQVLGSDTKEA